MTEEQLARRRKWFWRDDTEAHKFVGKPDYVTRAEPCPAGEHWKSIEQAVYRYELARREKSMWQSRLSAFVDLTPAEQEIFIDILSDPDLADDYPDFIPLRTKLIVECDIFASDREWKAALDKKVSEHRKYCGIAKLKGPKERNLRHAPWRWVELIDIFEAQRKKTISYPPFNKIETSAHSKARKRAHRCAVRLREQQRQT